MNKIIDFLQWISMKNANKMVTYFSNKYEDEIKSTLLGDTDLSIKWTEWLQENAVEHHMKTKTGLPIYIIKFSFSDYLNRKGFIETFPSFNSLMSVGGFATTTLCDPFNPLKVLSYLVLIDTDIKYNEKEAEFFLWHELGHCYYEHLDPSKEIIKLGNTDILFNIHDEYEADKFAFEKGGNYIFKPFRIGKMASIGIYNYYNTLMTILNINDKKMIKYIHKTIKWSKPLTFILLYLRYFKLESYK